MADTFNVRPQWKEELIYSEGEQEYVFQCGWGVSPPVVYVPDEAKWDKVMPPWMCGRRAEILARLESTGHAVDIDPKA